MLITIGSVTTASRLARLTEKKLGIPAQVVHTPAEINKGGCSYSVRIKEQYREKEKRLAEEYGVPVRKWYSEGADGGKRVYNAVP